MARFRDVLPGEWFDFIGSDRMLVSFSKRCKKIGARRYEDEDGVVHRVGSIDVEVHHVASDKASPAIPFLYPLCQADMSPCQWPHCACPTSEAHVPARGPFPGAHFKP